MRRRSKPPFHKPSRAAADAVVRLFAFGSDDQIQQHIDAATDKIQSEWTAAERESRRVSKTRTMEITRIALGNAKPRKTEY